MKTEEVGALYDKKIADEYRSSYEDKRWFSTPLRKAHYEMARDTLLYLFNLEKNSPSQVLEVGPGPGTWTKLLLEKSPNAEYTLVDVSKEMLSLAKENLKNYTNVQFIHSGFLESKLSASYDFFFSSRAIEYIKDKKAFAKKLKSLINLNGSGVIITKNPKYVRAFLRGRKVSELHKDQIRPALLRAILRDNGFEILNMVPVTLNFPLIKSPALGKALFSLFGKRPLTPISSFFAESYAIRFKKV
jgi:ubiquinone/menaquinone biosynthesis C-methylase UbiE